MATALSRELFPICREWRYLNHASVNALATPVAQAMTDWIDAAVSSGCFAGDAEEDVQSVRDKAAGLMGVDPTELAFLKNTSEGLAFVAAGLAWTPGDRILIPGGEFPSNVYPWRALESRGVTVEVLAPRGTAEAVTAEDVKIALEQGPPPKLLALSWVQFRRGWRTDLSEVTRVAHGAGALVCVDVIQGLGVIPAELGRWGVDFASGGSHKWLLAPPGIGLFYVRQEVMDRLRPVEPGWASVSHREEWDNMELVWDGSARRFESGTLDLCAVAGLGASIDLLLRTGTRRIWEHVDGLCTRLVDGLEDCGAKVLSQREAKGSSGIVTFIIKGRQPADLVEQLKDRKVIVSPRGDGIRVSPHGYNSNDDIDELLAALREILRVS